jgi:hypothetical protein
MRCASLATLGAAFLFAGCAAAPTPPADAPLARWTQLGPGGAVAARAIVAAGQRCPDIAVDGAVRPMAVRALATAAGRPPRGGNPAFDPDFAATACEAEVPPSAQSLAVGGLPLAPRKAGIRRVVVLGDTGCRIKVPATGKGDPVQDCADPAAWPWPRVAAAAARTRPDLVIHVGDYHYREYCDDPARCRAVRAGGVALGYGWAGWNADFFAPAAPLLAAAPWVFVRGNHENCDRAGEGWMRFLSPLPYSACPDQRYRSATRSVLGNNLTAPAYRIDIDDRLGLLVADNSGHEDWRAAAGTPHDLGLFREALAALREAGPAQRLWFLSHRPIWYALLDPAVQPNAFQLALRELLPARVQLAFGGHQHAFETIDFAPDADPAHHPAGRPAQVIVGGGGTQLEALDPDSALYEGKSGAGSRERAGPDGRLYEGVAARSGLVLNRYGFFLLERDGDGWTGTVLDPDGGTITRCRIGAIGKEIACAFPGELRSGR